MSPPKSTRSSQLISKATESRVFCPPLLVPHALPPPLPLCRVPGGELEPNCSGHWIYIRSGTYWFFVSCRLSTGSIVPINEINVGNQPQLAVPFDTSGKIYTWHQLVRLFHFFFFFSSHSLVFLQLSIFNQLYCDIWKRCADRQLIKKKRLLRQRNWKESMAAFTTKLVKTVFMIPQSCRIRSVFSAQFFFL